MWNSEKYIFINLFALDFEQKCFLFYFLWNSQTNEAKCKIKYKYLHLLIYSMPKHVQCISHSLLQTINTNRKYYMKIDWMANNIIVLSDFASLALCDQFWKFRSMSSDSQFFLFFCFLFCCALAIFSVVFSLIRYEQQKLFKFIDIIELNRLLWKWYSTVEHGIIDKISCIWCTPNTWANIKQ